MVRSVLSNIWVAVLPLSNCSRKQVRLVRAKAERHPPSRDHMVPSRDNKIPMGWRVRVGWVGGLPHYDDDKDKDDDTHITP